MQENHSLMLSSAELQPFQQPAMCDSVPTSVSFIIILTSKVLMRYSLSSQSLAIEC